METPEQPPEQPVEQLPDQTPDQHPQQPLEQIPGQTPEDTPSKSLGNRPRECHTKHLTELERFRVRTLYYDAKMSTKRISDVTHYSLNQIRTAIRAKSAAVPPRSGRPKTAHGKTPTKRAQTQAQTEARAQVIAGASPSSQGLSSGDPAATPSSSTTSAEPLSYSPITPSSFTNPQRPPPPPQQQQQQYALPPFNQYLQNYGGAPGPSTSS